MAEQLVAHCKACGARFAAEERLAGKRVACPSCKQPIDIPSLAGEAMPVAKLAKPAAPTAKPAAPSAPPARPPAPPAKPSAPPAKQTAPPSKHAASPTKPAPAAAKPAAPAAQKPTPAPAPARAAKPAPAPTRAVATPEPAALDSGDLPLAPLDDLLADLPQARTGGTLPGTTDSPLANPLGAPQNALNPLGKPTTTAPPVQWQAWATLLFDTVLGWTVLGTIAMYILCWFGGIAILWTSLAFFIWGWAWLVMLSYRVHEDAGEDGEKFARGIARSPEGTGVIFVFLAFRALWFAFTHVTIAWRANMIFYYAALCWLIPICSAWWLDMHPIPQRDVPQWLSGLFPRPKPVPGGALAGGPAAGGGRAGFPAGVQGPGVQAPVEQAGPSKWFIAVDPAPLEQISPAKWTLSGSVPAGGELFALPHHGENWAAFHRQVGEERRLEVYNLKRGTTALALGLPMDRNFPYSQLRIRDDGELAVQIGPTGLQLLELGRSGKIEELPKLKSLEGVVAEFMSEDRLLTVETKERPPRFSLKPVGPKNSLYQSWVDLENNDAAQRMVVAVSPGGRYFAMVGDQVRIYDPTRDFEERTIGITWLDGATQRALPEVRAACFSRNGQELMVLRSGVDTHLVTFSMHDGKMKGSTKLGNPPPRIAGHEEIRELPDGSGWWLRPSQYFIPRDTFQCFALQSAAPQPAYQFVALLDSQTAVINTRHAIRVVNVNLKGGEVIDPAE